MSSSEEARMVGPMPSREWMDNHRERLNQLERESQAADTNDFLAHIAARAQREVARWTALPCEGAVDRLSACSEAFSETCAEKEHSMCPRRQVARLVMEERLRKGERRKELEEQGVTERTLGAIFDREPLETEAVLSMRNAFAATPKPSIVVLQGGVGCGKSCAATLWAVGCGAKWLTAKSLARMGYEAELTQLGRAPHLVIDDLGVEYADQKGFFVSNLDGLIDDRYARNLPTVITTNVPPEEFKARYGDRIWDRLKEAGRFIKVKGESLRVRK